MPDYKVQLPESEIPTAWYNIQADLPRPLAPPRHPVTHQPLTPDDMAPLFPMALIEQEMGQERWVDIPGEVIDIYRLWRPSPLYRALRLEKALDTPAHIYYKWEGVSPAGSHKPNTAVAQAYYNKAEGVKRLTTETGAGQWGSALAMGCAFFGLECKVYMVRVSYNQKPYRRIMMETWGATCVPSPSEDTEAGRRILAQDPDSPGSLGIAISEAAEDAAKHEDTHYSLGSVLNHVLMHQTVNGLEAQKQFRQTDDYPDIVVGCVGGGSNYAGLCLPFTGERITKGKDIHFIAVEPEACPTITRGPYRYDFGDTAETLPLVMMHTLGHTFVPPPVHAGGLRYHGMAPIISLLCEEGLMEARAVHQTSAFQAAILFARTEGIVSAPETSHAIRVVIDEALKCRESGESKTILFNHSGHGLLDLAAYEAYLSGRLQDYAFPREEVEKAIASIPRI